MTDGLRRRALDRIPIVRRIGRQADEGPPFVEGLVIGALVGAAIAGSTLWSRWRETQRRRTDPPPS